MLFHVVHYLSFVDLDDNENKSDVLRPKTSSCSNESLHSNREWRSWCLLELVPLHGRNMWRHLRSIASDSRNLFMLKILYEQCFSS